MRDVVINSYDFQNDILLERNCAIALKAHSNECAPRNRSARHLVERIRRNLLGMDDLERQKPGPHLGRARQPVWRDLPTVVHHPVGRSAAMRASAGCSADSVPASRGGVLSFGRTTLGLRSRTGRCRGDAPSASSITATRAASTRRTRSRSAAASAASSPRWARSATAMTTRWPRASSPPSNANSSTANGSRLGPRRAGPSSSTSKGGITPTGATPASVIHPPSTSRGAANPPIERQAMNRPRKRGNSTAVPQRDTLRPGRPARPDDEHLAAAGMDPEAEALEAPIPEHGILAVGRKGIDSTPGELRGSLARHHSSPVYGFLRSGAVPESVIEPQATEGKIRRVEAHRRREGKARKDTQIANTQRKTASLRTLSHARQYPAGYHGNIWPLQVPAAVPHVSNPSRVYAAAPGSRPRESGA